MALIMGIVFLILSAGTCAYIASVKHLSNGIWFFMGLLFSVFALIAVCATPARTKEEKEASILKKQEEYRERARQQRNFPSTQNALSKQGQPE